MNRGDERPKRSPDEQVPEELSEPRPGARISKTDESRLLDQAIRGDMEAFADLFERFRPDLYTLCVKRLNDPSLAEDIVQEVFIRAFMNLPQSDHRKPIWPWLATIAIRMCIDLQRHRSLIHFSEDMDATVDGGANRGVMDDKAGSALDAVIASERLAELFQSLRVLSRRQRRVFLLYALDGWTCAEIAEAEGITLNAVSHLLGRVRKKMRATHENGSLALAPLPLIWLRTKLQESADRIRLLLNIHGEGWATACAQAACLGTVAMMVVAVGQPAGSLETDDPTRFAEYVASPARSDSLQTSLLQTTLSNGVAPAKASAESQQPVADPANLADSVINPNQNATPETTWFDSIVVSPNYQSDHTILASGWSHSNATSLGTYVLFVSNDGGASWKPRPSRFLGGSILALPPSFPQDRRVFAFGGNLGLDESDDGGEIFRMVSPIAGQGIAISPLFGSEGSQILVGKDSVFEFDAATGITQPFLPATPLALGGGGVSHIAYSPTYRSDSTVFVSKGGDLYRCNGLICDKTQIPYGPLRFRFSPCDQEGVAYAFDPWTLLVTQGGARNFGEILFPVDFKRGFYSRSIQDMAILCNSFSDPAIFTSVTWSASSSSAPTGVYRSLDVGRSWSKISIDLPGFGWGARKLMVTPTGRLLVTGRGPGIACSVDLGETWARRCPPE